MRFFTTTAVLVGLTAFQVSATPVQRRNIVSVPAADGLPLPNSNQLMSIQNKARGTLPNGPSPAKISAEGVTNLQLIALNEQFEVAFFNELLTNVTNNVRGYTFSEPARRAEIITILTAVVAQEELHAIAANNALKGFGFDVIQPCKYQFPVNTFDDAINLAITIGDFVLGTLQDVVQIFGDNGDSALARLVSSVIGQEGEQLGFYRRLENKIPSELPFLTTSVRDYAFTAIQGFTVSGSCPNNLKAINLKTFAPLNIVTKPSNTSNTIQFEFKAVTGTGNFAKVWSGQPLFAVFINQLNTPVFAPVKIEKSGDCFIGTAASPLARNQMNGLTITALVDSTNSTALKDIVNNTIFAPALIVTN